ncbi:MAG: hypothetical protein ABJB55_08405, partial [Actinomycetota bacterium]
MPETRFENEVRDALRAEAQTPSFDPSSASRATAAARRRLVRNGIATALICAVVVVVSLGGIRLAVVDSSVPVSPSTPKPASPPGDGVIAFSRGNGLWEVRPDGSGEAALAQSCVGETCKILDQAWSPTGSMVAFSHYGEKSGDFSSADGPLYLAASDGTDVRALTDCHWPGDCWDSAPAWSPDGSRIAFVRGSRKGSAGSARGSYALYSCSSDGGDLIQISGPGASVAPIAASWSPDGSELTYVEWEPGSGLGRSLVVTAADGTGQTVIVSGTDNGDPYAPAWSPDGSRIAYAWQPKSRVDPVEIRLVGTDGSHLYPIFASSGLSGPVWSPDGTHLAVIGGDSDNSLAERSLFVMNADGTSRTLLARGALWSSPV